MARLRLLFIDRWVLVIRQHIARPPESLDSSVPRGPVILCRGLLLTYAPCVRIIRDRVSQVVQTGRPHKFMNPFKDSSNT